MKKILFALVALLPLFVSCEKAGKSDNVFENPQFFQYAGKLIPRSAIMTMTSLTKAEVTTGPLQSIESPRAASTWWVP